MTEKRFTFDIDDENGTDEPYFCNGMDSFYVDNADEMELFIKEINALVDENQDLVDCANHNYQQFKMMESFFVEKIQNSKKENEQLKKENKELKKENDILIKQRLSEERLKQEIADYHTSNGKLHRLNHALLKRLDEFHIEYSDILRDFE